MTFSQVYLVPSTINRKEQLYMGRRRTAEEIKNSYKEKMGDELGKVFYLLW